MVSSGNSGQSTSRGSAGTFWKRSTSDLGHPARLVGTILSSQVAGKLADAAPAILRIVKQIRIRVADRGNSRCILHPHSVAFDRPKTTQTSGGRKDSDQPPTSFVELRLLQLQTEQLLPDADVAAGADEGGGGEGLGAVGFEVEGCQFADRGAGVLPEDQFAGLCQH